MLLEGSPTLPYDLNHGKSLNEYFYFAKKDRDVVFKTGKPEDVELLSLASEILPISRPLGVVLGLREATLDQIYCGNSAELSKSFGMLKKWKQSLGPGASYQALAEGLIHPVIERLDLAVKYCYNNDGKELNTGKYFIFQCGEIVCFLLAYVWFIFEKS